MVHFSMLLEGLLSLCCKHLHKVKDLQKTPGLVYFEIHVFYNLILM